MIETRLTSEFDSYKLTQHFDALDGMRAIGVGIILSDVLYRYVEQPFIAIGKKILLSKKQTSARRESLVSSSV